MFRRVAEHVVVALATSVLTWAVANRGDSAGAADELIDRVMTSVVLYGSPLRGWLWIAALVLLAIGICMQIMSMAPPHLEASWEWSLTMPSLATTLTGIGAWLALGATAVDFAEMGSLWVLPLLAEVLYWAYRWMTGIRYRWTRMAGTV